MEIANMVFEGGAYYPGPYLIKFPGFDFPLAIVFAGASMVYILHRISRLSFDWLDKKYTYPIILLILSWICVPIEFVFTNLGFWQYVGWTNYEAGVFFTKYSLIDYLWTYGYTLAYLLPSIGLAKFLATLNFQGT
ncbi:MAG: hypothetical protein ACLFTQ_00965 [Candidatus Aenigmatarchaeota archaeon]